MTNAPKIFPESYKVFCAGRCSALFEAKILQNWSRRYPPDFKSKIITNYTFGMF